jgi:hypothetical protein
MRRLRRRADHALAAGLVMSLLAAPSAIAQSGSAGPVTDLSDAGANAFSPDVAADANGNIVAVWTRHDGTAWRVQAASQPAGGQFAPAQDLSAPGEDATDPRIAVAPNGDVVVAWLRPDGQDVRVQAAVRPAGGAFGAPQTLSPAGRDARSPDVAVDPLGNAIVVWSRSEPRWLSDRVQVAERPAGAVGFTLAPAEAAPAPDPPPPSDPPVEAPVLVRDVSAPGASGREPRVAMDPTGGTYVAWLSEAPGEQPRVRAVVRPAGGAFGAPQDLSSGGRAANAIDIAAAQAGTAYVVWRERGKPPRQRAFINVKPADGTAFTAPAPPFVERDSPSKLSSSSVNGRPEIAGASSGLVVAAFQHGGCLIAIAPHLPGVVPDSDYDFLESDVEDSAGCSAAAPWTAIDGSDTTVIVWRERVRASKKFRVNAAIYAPRMTPRDPDDASIDARTSAGIALSPDGQHAMAPHVAIAGSSSAVAVWRRYDGGHWRIQTAPYRYSTKPVPAPADDE